MNWNNPFQTKSKSQIQRIGIHHFAIDVGSQRIFENHWRNEGNTLITTRFLLCGKHPIKANKK